MAKNKMQMKYKRAKRERNKNKVELTAKDQVISFLKTLGLVVVFIGVLYLGILGMKSLGLFEKGYTKPTSEATISYEYILLGTVFDRNEKEYYVIFDDFEKNLYSHISSIVSKKNLPVYKVDMSKSENALFKSEESNPNAKNVDELKINGLTVVKIKNGKIDKYYTGLDNIEAYFN